MSSEVMTYVEDMIKKRLSDPERWSFGELGHFYNRDKKTVHEAFERYLPLYATDKQITKYREHPANNIYKTRKGDSDRTTYYSEYYRKNKEKKNFNNRNNVHLKRFGQKSTDITLERWKEMLKKCGYKCQSCGRKRDQWEGLTMDHIKSPKAGGLHMLENIQVLCLRCNALKGEKDTNFKLSTGVGHQRLASVGK